MTNYSDNPGHVRVDYFKASGKWYMTETLDMNEFYDRWDIHKAIQYAMQEQEMWRPHFTQVILHPYHQNAHPIMFVATDG